jgi:leucyl aminopeptidase
MQADIFYTTIKCKARNLILVSYEEFNKKSPAIDKETMTKLYHQQFKGNLGDIALILDDSHEITTIYFGAGSDDISKALAKAAITIPSGTYALQTYSVCDDLISWALAQYKYDRYKKSNLKPCLLLVKNIELLKIKAKIESIFIIRDLINTPTNDMGPLELSNTVKELAILHGAQFKEWVGQELICDNFPAIHTVGRASNSEPRLISLTYGNKNHPKVCLVGKGVCFDSGGLDIKPSSGLRLMKKDMGGAAHVIGLANWIMAEKLPIHLQVYIPAVENSISGNAYRPGDVITMRNGLTVEVDNTDAEGRLVLADAIVKACEDKPELLIDFATLTGAARIAVGTDISAMFCNDDNLANEVLKIASATKDPICRLPLHRDYRQLFKSTIADMTNSATSPYAGAITAALFIEFYVSNNIPWIHFDIMAWNLTSRPGKPEGGEAMGFMAISKYLSMKYKKNT